jgi:hypothetical protein
MSSTTREEVEGRWRDERDEYLGLIIGLLCSKGVPIAAHRRAREDVLLACWISLELGLLPQAGLPTFYHLDDPLRAAVYNWFILLVNAWKAIHVERGPAEPRVGAAAVAHEVVSFVRALPDEARATLRCKAGLALVH